MNKVRLGIALLVFAIIALALPLIANADHQWGKYSWPSDGGPVLNLGDNLTNDWDPFLTVANSDWNDSDFIDNAVVPGNAASVTSCTPETGAVEICNSDYGNNGWLGIAGISIAKGKQITRGYVKLNDFYFDQAFYNGPWKQMVMCQEIGHVFGLAHQDENFTNDNLDTCMDYTNDPGSNQHPNQHDYDQLADMYGSGGGGGGSGGGPPGGDGPPGRRGNSEFGRAIGYDDHGRANEFVRILGNGEKAITHVLWAN